MADLWNVNNTTLETVAVNKLARQLQVNVGTLRAFGVQRLSGLYVYVTVIDNNTRKRHEVAVYDREVWN